MGARGLTLIELLVVMALFALVAGTLGATFSGGMAVWERFETDGMRKQWTETTLDQFRHDMHEVRRFKPVAFDGAYDSVSFPAVVEDRAHPDRPGEMGRMGYYWDRRHDRLCRVAQPYRLLSRSRLTDPDACQAVAEDIKKVQFSFYARDPSDGSYAWTGSWSDPEPPLAVKLELTYADGENSRGITQDLVVPVPVAKVKSKDEAHS